MIKKIISIVVISFLLSSCGFTPILKNSENHGNTLIHYEIDSSSAYQARQLLNSIFKNLNKDKAKYIVKVKTLEMESAVNIESSGSVKEYKVEALVSFKIYEIKTNNIIFESQTRGFANYDVSNSEYTNTLVKEDAIDKALTNGLQLMSMIVQSKVN